MFQYAGGAGIVFASVSNSQLPLSGGIFSPVVNGEEWPVIKAGADPVLWPGQKEV